MFERFRRRVRRIPVSADRVSSADMTDRARRVMVLAQEEARLLNHNFIGTEHVLLGLIHEGEGVAVKALGSLGDFEQTTGETRSASIQAGVSGGHRGQS